MDNNTSEGTLSSPIVAVNGKVACEPFPLMSVEKEQRGGMVVPKQKGTLTKLAVKYTSGKFGQVAYVPRGASVWVRSEQFTLQWAKDVFEWEGVKFILVPEDQIVMVQHA